MCPLNWTFPPWMLHKIPQKIDDSSRQDGNDDREWQQTRGEKEHPQTFFFFKHGIDDTFGRKGTL